jgi:TonB family protein
MVREDVSVEVRVKIDRAGNVVDAVPLNPSSSVARLLSPYAAQAALLWKFQPARQNGIQVPSEMTLQFSFGGLGR